MTQATHLLHRQKNNTETIGVAFGCGSFVFVEDCGRFEEEMKKEMNYKPIIIIRLLLLKNLFNILDALSNIEKLHKYIINKKIYLGTAIVSLSIVNSSCNTNNKSINKQKKDTSSNNTMQNDQKKDNDSLQNTLETKKTEPTFTMCYKTVDTTTFRLNKKRKGEKTISDSVIEFVINDAQPSCYLIEVADPIDKVKETFGEPSLFVVEENAIFQEGDLSSFRNWVQANLVYPQLSADNGIEGRLFVQFAINSKGEICDINILRSTGDPLLDNEAVRVIKTSPLWKPARQSGSNVKQQFTIPVTFKLHQ